jgi:hypothetical protein
LTTINNFQDFILECFVLAFYDLLDKALLDVAVEQAYSTLSGIKQTRDKLKQTKANKNIIILPNFMQVSFPFCTATSAEPNYILLSLYLCICVSLFIGTLIKKRSGGDIAPECAVNLAVR